MYQNITFNSYLYKLFIVAALFVVLPIALSPFATATVSSCLLYTSISKPGITKGEHWHHTKWEQFIVVSGHGLIQLRNENDPNGEILEYEVSGDKIQSVIMLPGYTHNIVNLSDTQNLITVMYCNEIFNPERPDTFFDKVVKE